CAFSPCIACGLVAETPHARHLLPRRPLPCQHSLGRHRSLDLCLPSHSHSHSLSLSLSRPPTSLPTPNCDGIAHHIDLDCWQRTSQTENTTSQTGNISSNTLMITIEGYMGRYRLLFLS